MTETVAAFERHLLDHLDDTAGWSAYADYLTERGDPRGDFMRVQLALEDETLPKAERRALQEEEEALRVKHLEMLVGPLFAANFYDARSLPHSESGAVTFRRGWAWAIEDVGTEGLPEDTFDGPALRWLRTVKLREYAISLEKAPFVGNLRDFQVGHDEIHSSCGYGLEADMLSMIANASRLERLYLACGEVDTSELFMLPLPLRELHVHCETRYTTDALAENPAFANLTTLAFHPHGFYDWGRNAAAGAYLTAADVRAIAFSPHLKQLEHLQLNCLNAGDEGIDLLVSSGLIYRLKSLDLRHGCVSDEGAFTLFKALDSTPHALDTLKLDDNALTGDGLAALRRLNLTLDAGGQHAPGDTDYLTQGDFE